MGLVIELWLIDNDCNPVKFPMAGEMVQFKEFQNREYTRPLVQEMPPNSQQA